MKKKASCLSSRRSSFARHARRFFFRFFSFPPPSSRARWCRFVGAGAIGASGLVLLFWHDLFTTLDGNSLRGIAWAGFGGN